MGNEFMRIGAILWIPGSQNGCFTMVNHAENFQLLVRLFI